MAEVTIYGTNWCGDCHRVKQFLNERGVVFREVNIDEVPTAEQLVLRVNNGRRKVPTLDVEGTIVSGDKFNAARFEEDLRAAGAL